MTTFPTIEERIREQQKRDRIIQENQKNDIEDKITMTLKTRGIILSKWRKEIGREDDPYCFIESVCNYLIEEYGKDKVLTDEPVAIQLRNTFIILWQAQCAQALNLDFKHPAVSRLNRNTSGFSIEDI